MVKERIPVVGVLLAGGRGERFWPLSRRRAPKPLLRLGASRTLLEGTLSRLRGWIPEDRLFVVTSEQLGRSIKPALVHYPKVRIIHEPMPRNTASAVALAALEMKKRFGDAVMVVLPIDHAIDPVVSFLSHLERAVRIAREDPKALLLFGIKPRAAATGLGYVCAAGGARGGALNVSRFVEKPSRQEAQKLCRRRNVFWNSGMFVFRASAVLEAIREAHAEMEESLPAMEQALAGRDGWKRLCRIYRSLPSISLDHAVLQKARGLRVIPSSFSWYDLGTWPSLDALLPTDPQGNRALGVRVSLGTKGSILVSDRNHLLATLGVRDLIVVHTPDATLVTTRERAEQVRELVQAIERKPQLRRFL